MSEPITEEMGVHKEWYAEARKMTPETLPEFIRKLTQDYDHDYGTICHACAAAAVAAAWAVDKSPHGGITGFQAGAIMWEFIRHWNGIDGPTRLLQYNDLLYPQMEHKFTEISRDTWESIQTQARKNLDEHPVAAETVVAHWRTVADGVVPFGLRLEAESTP